MGNIARSLTDKKERFMSIKKMALGLIVAGR